MNAILLLAASALAGPPVAQTTAEPPVLLLPPVADPRPPVFSERRSFSISAADPDMVLRWNEILLQAVRTDRTPPPLAARNLAIVHGAVHDAVSAVARTHCPFLVDVQPVSGTSAESAAAAAAHRTLSALYPAQRRGFDDALATCLAGVADPQARDSGVSIGQFVADKYLEWRASDSALLSGQHTVRMGVGVWQPTLPAFAPALLPSWTRLMPFALRENSLRQPPGPPPLTSAAYAGAFKEVKELGSRYSSARTPEQSTIALFWADGDGTSTPPGHWNRIAQDVARARRLSLAENARLFALLNISLADAGLACWIIKFNTELWRPVTAIRRADQDGNPDTDPDPDWEPLLVTPPFPSYTSGHSTFSGAAAAVLRSYFAADEVPFTTTSEGLPGVHRSFASFSAAATEAGRSRIYGGIHYEFDNVDALANGRAVGEFVFRHYLHPRANGHTAARFPLGR